MSSGDSASHLHEGTTERGGLFHRMAHVEYRMDGMERVAGSQHDQLVQKIDGLYTLIGSPSNGPAQPSSGLFHKIDTVERRLQPFEKLRERYWGAIIVATPVIGALWWLGGDKIAKLFHGS